MARCRLSDRKVRSKIRPLVPKALIVAGAMVRGGSPHNLVLVCCLDGSIRKAATLDKATGAFELHDEGWMFSDESGLAASIAYINGNVTCPSPASS